MRTARQRHGGSRKFCQFRLSQALANQVVRKGVCGDFILCGLSPPVSASWSLVHRYTLLTTRGCTRILGCTVAPALAHAENTLLQAVQTAVRGFWYSPLWSARY